MKYIAPSFTMLTLVSVTAGCDDFTCADYATCPVDDAGNMSVKTSNPLDAGISAAQPSDHSIQTASIATEGIPSNPANSVTLDASSNGSSAVLPPPLHTNCDAGCTDASIQNSDSENTQHSDATSLEGGARDSEASELPSSGSDSGMANTADESTSLADTKDDAATSESLDSGRDAESDELPSRGECLTWGEAQEQAVQGIRLDGLMKLETDGIGAMALWTALDSTVSQYRMFAAAFDGSTWGPTEAISTNTTVFAGYNASIGQANFDLAYSGGQAIATWIEWTSPPQIVGSRFINGSWTLPTVLSGEEASNVGTPVADIANNRSIVAWVESADNEYSLVSIRWNGTWSTAEKVSEMSNSGTAFARSPNVAVNESGATLLTWIDDGVNARYFDGEAWSESVRVASHDTAGSGSSALTNVLGLLAWTRVRDGASSEVYGSILRNGVWGAPKLLGSGSDTFAFEPKVSAEGDDAVVVWNSSKPDEDDFTTYAVGVQDGEWTPPVNLSGTPQGSFGQPTVVHTAGVSVSTWNGIQGPLYSCSSGSESWSTVDTITPLGQPTLGVLSMGLSPHASQGLVFLVDDKLWISRWN